MSNKETAAEIRRWCDGPGLPFSWPTDGCGYDQHMAFVKHRNEHWTAERALSQSFYDFCREYADALERDGVDGGTDESAPSEIPAPANPKSSTEPA